MRVVNWQEVTAQAGELREDVSLTIGVFDGLHSGHRYLIELLKSSPQKGAATVVTFKNNPVEVMQDNFQGNINSFRQKCKNFGLSGVDILVCIDFSYEFSKMSGKDFLNCLLKKFNICRIVMGPHFRFGYQGDTRMENIKDLLPECEILATKAVETRGVKISSTRIRQLIIAGDIRKANRMLFSNYALDVQAINSELLDADSFPQKALRQVWPGEGCYKVKLISASGSEPGIVEILSGRLQVLQPVGINLKNIQEIIFIENRHERSKICH